MSKAQITDILLIGFISGVVAILTSMMGISGTIIGAVVTSIIAEFLKTYFKEPLKDKISEREKEENIYTNSSNQNHTYEDSYPTNNNYNVKGTYPRPKRRRKVSRNRSFITTKMLFLFPLVVILIIEVIHLLGAIHIIPYDIFFTLESITNWTLLRTIGFALIIMGIYPLVTKKFGSHHGIILIIVGIIELIFGFADVNSKALFLSSLVSSLREYVNIAIILAILYVILTIPEELNEKRNVHRFN